ncbi:hypothetical protein PIROE2DRAFT_24515, partial [Piromyces sp. E2]
TASIRSMVTSKEAGVIIGREGKNITKIREDSTAKVTVSEHVPGSLDRIITVTGEINTVVKAFFMMTKLIIVEFEKEKLDLYEHRSLTLRILVPDNRMGSIIGKGGSKIKEIQEKSKSTIVASEDILPNSTEKVLKISGTVDAIRIAIYDIGNILRENPDRNLHTIYYKPTPMLNKRSVNSASSQSSAFPVQVKQLYITNEFVRCIIGKHGESIKQIRNVSGSQIVISVAHPNSTDRLITITGNNESNKIAENMILRKIENEKNKM